MEHNAKSQDMRGSDDAEATGAAAGRAATGTRGEERRGIDGSAMADEAIDGIKKARRHAVFARRRAMGADERERYGQALAAHAADLLAMAGTGTSAMAVAGTGVAADGTASAGATAGGADANRADGRGPSRGIGNHAPVIAAFVSMGTEPPMAALLQELLQAGARLLVPRLGAGRDLGWAWLDGLDELGDMGERRPQEPDAPTLPADAMADVDLVVMPALEVDAMGDRLGRGGGWYDRMLTLRRPDVPAVAVVYPWERVDVTLPHAAHDMPVDATLTDAGLASCGVA